MNRCLPAFEEIRDQLLPRIQLPGDEFALSLIPDQLDVAVCWTDETGIHSVTAEMLTEWNLSLEDTLQLAVWNLRRLTHQSQWEAIPTVNGLYGYNALDGLSASRMLCLDTLLRPWPMEGVLISAPTPNQLLVVPLTDIEALNALRVLVLAGDTAVRVGTNPLSNQVFWFDGAQWEIITVEHMDESVELHPSPRFVEALERLTAITLVSAAAEA